MKDPVFMAILKYKNYPSILAVREIRKNSIFCFKEVTIEEIQKEINKFSSRKASQNRDIPTRIVKENADIFVGFLCKSLSLLIVRNNQIYLKDLLTTYRNVVNRYFKCI